MSQNALNRGRPQYQQEGNDIIIFPTPATTTTRTTSSLATNDENLQDQSAAAVEKDEAVAVASNNNVTWKLRKPKYGSAILAYIHQTLSRIFNFEKDSGNINSNIVVNSNNSSSNAVDKTAASCFPFKRWRRDLNSRRRRKYRATAIATEMKKTRIQEFLWCFRPVGTAAAFKSSPTAWTEFEKKNQIELSRQLHLLNNRLTTQASFEIQDKHIFNNTMVLTVMLKEGIAFVLDPEWSMPITYEITFKPKLNWYQEIRMRLEYQKWLKEQQKRQLS